jgi:hypothetical protein
MPRGRGSWSPGKFYAFRLGDRVHKIDLTGDQYRDQPKRKRGITTVRDVDSFLSLWSKHSDEDSRDLRRPGGAGHHRGAERRPAASVDDADGAGARWRDHRVVQLAGAGFLRLDVPPAGEDPGRTQYLSPGSVYALHPVSEETARRAAGAWRPAPVQRWELPAAPVPPSREDIEDLATDLNDEGEDADEQPF